MDFLERGINRSFTLCLCPGGIPGGTDKELDSNKLNMAWFGFIRCLYRG